MSQPTVAEQTELFIKLLGELYVQHYTENGHIGKPPRFTVENGSKFTRIVENKTDFGGGKSVYCFIDRSNGDILKAAGWKAPAKGARGSIFNPNCDVGVKATVYGSGLYIR
jgi:hypothetical protein